MNFSSLKQIMTVMCLAGIVLFPVSRGQESKKIAPKPTIVLCEVRGLVINVPDYLKVNINLSDSHVAGVRGLMVPPNTGSQPFAFSVPCNGEGNEWYWLIYLYRKKCGVNSWSEPKAAFKPADSYAIKVVVKGDHKIYTDPTRYFGQLSASGILLEDMRTDRASYTFGDVVNLIFRVTVKGPPGFASVVERGTYVVTVDAGGISLEAKRDEITVALREEKTITVPIHHTFYSRGRNAIKLYVESSDYHFDQTVYCMID